MRIPEKHFNLCACLISVAMLTSSLHAMPKKHSEPVAVPFEAELSPLILIPVRINNTAPLWFIFDTGAGTSVIDSDTAGKLGLKIENPQQTPEPGGAITEGTVSSVTVQIGSALPEHCSIQAAPIGQLGRYIGHDFAGIIGTDLIQRYTIKIDYAAHELLLLSPEDFKPAADATEIPIDIVDGQVFIPIQIKNENHAPITGKFEVDTGSFDLLGLNNNFVVDNHLLDEKQSKIPAPGVAAGGATTGYLFLLEWAKVGPVTFDRPLVGYTTNSKGFENRPNAGGMGSALLSRFTVVLDYSRKRILLTPRDGAREHVPYYDMSGVLLNAEGPDWKRITIASVIPGSPAAEAGIQVGDQIVTIDSIVPSSLAQVSMKFRQQGSWRLKVESKGNNREVTLHTRPLL